MLGHKLCQDLPKLGYSVTGTIRRTKSYYDQYKYIFKAIGKVKRSKRGEYEITDALLSFKAKFEKEKK